MRERGVLVASLSRCLSLSVATLPVSLCLSSRCLSLSTPPTPLSLSLPLSRSLSNSPSHSLPLFLSPASRSCLSFVASLTLGRSLPPSLPPYLVILCLSPSLPPLPPSHHTHCSFLSLLLSLLLPLSLSFLSLSLSPSSLPLSLVVSLTHAPPLLRWLHAALSRVFLTRCASLSLFPTLFLTRCPSPVHSLVHSLSLPLDSVLLTAPLPPYLSFLLSQDSLRPPI